jgi:hypothetical protein
MDFAATGAYADAVLTNAECVVVPYVIGLTARQPFQFRVQVRGDNSG